MVHLAAAVIAVVRLAGGGDRSESSAARPRNGARIRRERSFLSGVGGREVDRTVRFRLYRRPNFEIEFQKPRLAAFCRGTQLRGATANFSRSDSTRLTCL